MSLDFVPGTLSDRRRFRILCIVDDYTPECLATVVDTSLGGVSVVRGLERLVEKRAMPETGVSDNGAELTRRTQHSSAEEFATTALKSRCRAIDLTGSISLPGE